MKSFFLYTFIALFCVLVLTTCDKKQRAIDGFGNFVERVEKNASKFTEEDWAKADKECEKMITEIDKYEYTDQETRRIGELVGRYVGIRTKESIKTIIEDIDKAAPKVEGALEGFVEGFIGSIELQEE